MTDNCLLIAGEKSGEEHALSFFDELREKLPQIHYWGVGGNQLESKGLELLYHLNDFSSMGFIEVVKKIPYYLNAQKRILDEVKKRKTKVAILIDFQDFNLRLARALKKINVEVLYYVAPQAWAWRSNRAKILAKTVHTLFTIIPFEKQWFNQRGVQNVMSITHPILKHYKPYLYRITEKKFEKKVVKILLLPGSRRMEIVNLMEPFIDAIKRLKNDGGFTFEVGIVCADSVPASLFDQFNLTENGIKKFDLVEGLLWADFSLACSGTVTLTAALFQVPTVVAYKTSIVSEFVFLTVVKYFGHISLANIVLEEQVFPEFKQNELDGVALMLKIKRWLTNEAEFTHVKEKLKLTESKLTIDNENVPNYLANIIEKCVING
ncbi:MAG: lipid-A-disaccharide synthase [Bacteriovoracaceae bacterium]